METLSGWILIVLLAISSPTKRAIQQQSPWFQASAAYRESAEAKESAADGEARYKQIAEDLAEVIESEKPLFAGPLGRQKTAALMLSIQFFESGFRRDVDLGLGKFGRGDFGRSWCLNQIQTGKMPGTVPIDHPEMSKWTGEDLVKDRKKCFRAGLEILRRSMAMCKSATVKKGEYYTVVTDKKPIRVKAEEDTVVPLTGGHRLSGYTSGKCQYGEYKALARWDFAWHNITWKFPFKPAKKVEPTPDAGAAAAAKTSAQLTQALFRDGLRAFQGPFRRSSSLRIPLKYNTSS